MHKHLLGSRFYVYSNDATHPNARTGRDGLLVAICHGFYQGAGTTAVRGVGECAFFCDHEDTVDVDELTTAFESIGSNRPGNGGFWHDRTNTSGRVQNYTLRKEIDGDAKKSFKGKQNYQFADSSYIASIYPGGATFDIIGLHNTWKSGRTVTLSDLFETLRLQCPQLYSRLYCGFCREILR